MQELNIQISRKGKAIIHRSGGSPTSAQVMPNPSVSRLSPITDAAEDGKSGAKQLVWLQHDRAKQLPISPTQPHPFLQKLGMQMPDGRIK